MVSGRRGSQHIGMHDRNRQAPISRISAASEEDPGDRSRGPGLLDPLPSHDAITTRETTDLSKWKTIFAAHK